MILHFFKSWTMTSLKACTNHLPPYSSSCQLNSFPTESVTSNQMVYKLLCRYCWISGVKTFPFLVFTLSLSIWRPLSHFSFVHRNELNYFMLTNLQANECLTFDFYLIKVSFDNSLFTLHDCHLMRSLLISGLNVFLGFFFIKRVWLVNTQYHLIFITLSYSLP